MDVTISSSRRRTRELVIALHCSGGGAGQWRALGHALGDRHELLMPEHYGCESTGHWTGEHTFTLADEAARTVALIDRAKRKVHLVGHSYGGLVALHVALARPEAIASLTLYEPAAFFLLRQFGEGAVLFAEMKAVADAIAQGLLSGDYRAAARHFVDYWSGAGAWDALRPPLQDALIRWLPKLPLDFTAAVDEPTLWHAYATFRSPVLIMRGEHAPAPTKFIADTLPCIFPDAYGAIVGGAGHMGPLTHADAVNALIVRHITGMASQARREAA